MSMQHDGMEFMSGLENTPAEQNSGQVAPNLLKLEECLLVARRLLGVIQDETKALKTFDTDQLLQLVTQKEALVRDLGGKLNALKSSVSRLQRGTDPRQGVASAGDSDLNSSSLDAI